jgi:hypothetical protein
MTDKKDIKPSQGSGGFLLVAIFLPELAQSRIIKKCVWMGGNKV